MESARTDDAAQVRLFDYRAVPQQMFAITQVGNGSFSIVARHSAQSIKATWNSKASGAVIQQWPYVGDENEIFTLTPAP